MFHAPPQGRFAPRPTLTQTHPHPTGRALRARTHPEDAARVDAALDAALRLDPAYAPALTLMKTYRRPGPVAK